MIYYTGDIHGDVIGLIRDMQRLGITRQDIIVILGDAGLNYYGDHRDSIKKLTLNEYGATVFCIHGNHEKRPQSIPSYEEQSWNGGVVYVEEAFPNILFAKDGELYDLDGYRAIVIGGAYSVDKHYRLQRGWAWFPDEQPSDEIKDAVMQTLNACTWVVDIVLSHTCPARYTPTEAFLPGLDQSTVDRSTENWLDTIEYKLDYGRWYCGHWHIDKHIDKLHFLMKNFETMPELETFSFDIDNTLWENFCKWCTEHGTTPDIITRSFFRRVASPGGSEYLQLLARDNKIEG